MNEKLNIIEAMKMPPYTEFKVLYDCGHYDKRTIKKLPSGYFEWSDKEQELLREGVLMAKFIPIQKPVAFEEARKEYRDNKKTIKSRVSERIFRNGIDIEIGFSEIEGQWIVLD